MPPAPLQTQAATVANAATTATAYAAVNALIEGVDEEITKDVII